MIENPFYISTNTFSNYNATLYVPVGTIDKYKSTESWKNFAHIKEINTPTGISPTSVNQTTDEKYYNISGARVDNPTKGIYIRNGNKVVK